MLRAVVFFIFPSATVQSHKKLFMEKNLFARQKNLQKKRKRVHLFHNAVISPSRSNRASDT